MRRRLPAPPHRSATLGLVLVGLLGAATGCLRSDLPPSTLIDCGDGGRVQFDASIYCVYPRASAPEACPDDLPNRFMTPDAVICAWEMRLSPGRIEDVATGAGFGDRVIQFVDAGGPRIVDQGGAPGDEI